MISLLFELVRNGGECWKCYLQDKYLSLLTGAEPINMGTAFVLAFFVPGICGSCGISKDLLFDYRII